MLKTQPKPTRSEKEAELYQSAPEISVFVACCVMVNELRALDRSHRNGDIKKDEFATRANSVWHRLRLAVAATQRFDVIYPVMETSFSPFFWRWYNWWDDYLKSLTPGEIVETERRARETGPLINQLRPKGHWVGYRKTRALELPPPPD